MDVIRAVREIAGHVREGKPPAVTFHPLLAGGRSAPAPPIFLLGAVNSLVSGEIFGQIDTPAIGCYVLEDAAVAPTGIAVKDGTAFCSSAFVHPPHHVVAVVDRLNAARLPVRHVPGQLAVIYGPGHETHGHWLTDFMPRLAVLAETGHDLSAIRLVVPPDLTASAAELLRLCGIADNQLVRYDYWREVLRTDQLLMPTGARLGNRMSPYFAQATAFWLARIRARTPHQRVAARTRLFVSRATAPQARQLTNRDAIEALARRQGLTVVQPGMMPFLEQIALFESADIIVGEYGSGLHNSIFAAPGTAVCGLRGNARHPGFIQSGIATALNQHVGYVFGDSPGQEAMQHFTIAEAAFAQALELLRLHAPG